MRSSVSPGVLIEIFNVLYHRGILVEFFDMKSDSPHPEEDSAFYLPQNYFKIQRLAMEINQRMATMNTETPRLLTYQGEVPEPEGVKADQSELKFS